MSGGGPAPSSPALLCARARAHGQPWLARRRHGRPAAGGTGPRPRESGGPGARGGGPRAHAGAPRGGRRRMQCGHRRRGDVPAPARRDSRREKNGKDEGRAGMLTDGSVWAEGGRRGEIEDRSGAPVRLAMAAGDGERDSTGERLNRARGGAGQVRSRARKVLARGNGEGRRTMAGAVSGGALHGLGSA